MMLTNTPHRQKPRDISWLLLISLTVLTYIVMVAITIPKVQSFTNGLMVPDLLPFGYDQDYLFLFLSTIGETGRLYYLLQLGIDMIYPALVSYSLYRGFKGYYKNKDIHHLRKNTIFTLTWAIMVFDYLENLMIFLQIISMPNKLNTVGILAPIFSVLKSSITTIMMTYALLLLVIHLTGKFGGEKHGN